jgi:hypothetical protein
MSGDALGAVLVELRAKVERQDAKHGPCQGTPLDRSRLVLATLEDETREALDAWRSERTGPHWNETRTEALQASADHDGPNLG